MLEAFCPHSIQAQSLGSRSSGGVPRSAITFTAVYGWILEEAHIMVIGEERDGISRAIVAPIGQRLRLLYAEVAAQPVPRRFTELLRTLEAGEQREDER